MNETFTFRMKISLLDYLNCYINLINEIHSLQEKTEALKDADGDIADSDIENIYNELNRMTDRHSVRDVGAQIIAGYMKDIAERAIELNDEKLLELLQGLEVISKTEEKEVQDAEHI